MQNQSKRGGHMIKKFNSVATIEKGCFIIGIFLMIWYSWILDDAYVYFRYVDNLIIHNVGLVYNSGEFVEGFSSPMWTMILIILRFFQINYWFMIRIIGVIAYIFFWYLLIKINRHLSQHHVDCVNFPLVYLTCTYGVMCYFTSGLETPLVILSAAGYATLFIFPQNRWLQVFIGLSPLIRHELLLPCFIMFIWICVRRRQFPFFLMLSFGIAGIGYELFRIWYYADFLPNTFYLKDEFWITQGFSYLYDTCLAYQTLPVLGIVLILYFSLRKQYGAIFLYEEERLMMLISALPVFLYVIKIGGDPRHFRYFAFPFCLAIISTGGILEIVLQRIIRKYRHAINAIAFCLAFLFLSNFPRQLQQHPLFRAHWGFSHSTFLKINDAAHHRFENAEITPPLRAIFPQTLSYSGASTRFYQQTSDIIATAWCKDAYLSPRSFVIHSLGLTEPFLARAMAKSDRPAHKYDLLILAEDLLTLRKIYGFRRGVFSEAISDNFASAWIMNNKASLELIENKAYNHHLLWDNMHMAVKRIERIQY